MTAARLEDAFARLQAGDAASALRIASEVAAMHPGNPRAHLAAGMALRGLGNAAAAREALERAARLAPGDYAPPFELGTLLEMLGRPEEAAAQFERSAALRPDLAMAHFAAGMQRYRLRDWRAASERFEGVLRLQPAHVEARMNLGQALAELGRGDEALAHLERAAALAPSAAAPRHALGWLLQRLGRRDEAHARYEEAIARDPRHLDARIALGREAAARADFAAAARQFTAAAAIAPTHPDLPMYAAQALLLLGRGREAWGAYYARRDSRVEYEARAAAAGRPYALPHLDALRGREVALVGEQGLGDILFFLRYAPGVRAAAGRLSFAGDQRLHGILARTGLFDSLVQAPPENAVPLLVGDLPLTLDAGDDVFAPSLRCPPLPERLEALRGELSAAGPRPWIAVTWRSGTPREVSREALSKSVPVNDLFAALAAVPGTVLALQRGADAAQITAASAALGRRVHDFSRRSEDPEDALAIVSLVDRHIGVSSTNMHLAALAGASAEVLVPFPPEWRWRASGDSPWFPGFRVYRQAPGGDWSAALGGLAR